jgi:hypothetical protein
MSKIYVDEILPKENARITAPNLQLPAGSVIQTVTRIFNGSTGTNSSSYADLGRFVSITPKYANSLIHVTYSATVYYNDSYGYFTFYRNGVNMHNQGDYDTNPTSQAMTQVGNSDSPGTTRYHPTSFSFIDTTHNSTSALEYRLYGKRAGGAGDLYWPPGSSDIATFTVMEIAQ